MGTETEALQKKIREAIGLLGWSSNDLADVIYHHENDDDDEETLRKFKETFKKQLSRKTTNPKLLERYLLIITQDDRYQKITVMPPFIASEELSSSMHEEMKKISRSINKQIKERDLLAQSEK